MQGPSDAGDDASGSSGAQPGDAQTDGGTTADAETDGGTTPRGVGEPCEADPMCEADLRCIDGTCARVAPGDTGKPCENEQECERGICLALGDGRKVCSVPCTTPNECAVGWSCGDDAGASGVCTCSPRAEACNGSDDDCDGVIDNPETSRVTCLALNQHYACVDGQCSCPASNVCNDVCVADLRSNPNHCGGCNTACASGVACEQSQCSFPLGITRNSNSLCAMLSSGSVVCDAEIADNDAGGLRTDLQGSTVALAPEAKHGCAVHGNGTVSCWGENLKGQAGHADTTATDQTLHLVAGLDRVRAVALGRQHTCALREDGTVWCWGYGSNHNLGVVPPQPGWWRATPEAVPGVANAVALAVGGEQNCALLADGHLTCWGGVGLPGMLPDGRSSGLAADAGLTDVQSVSLGSRHGCLVKTDATVHCWGENSHGKVGVAPGPINYIEGATAVVGLAGVRAVAASDTNSCALLGDGTVQCWGWYYANGTNSTESSHVPATVLGLAGVVSLPTAGGSCAILQRGQVSCWTSTTRAVNLRY